MKFKTMQETQEGKVYANIIGFTESCCEIMAYNLMHFKVYASLAMGGISIENTVMTCCSNKDCKEDIEIEIIEARKDDGR